MFFKKKVTAPNSRRFKRLRTEYLVKYQIPGAEGPAQVSNMKDLSAGGLKFWTETYIPEATLLRVSFIVPPLERTVETLSRVIRVRQAKNVPIYYIAVRFIEIPEDAKEALDVFIESLSQQSATRKYVTGRPLFKRNSFI